MSGSLPIGSEVVLAGALLVLLLLLVFKMIRSRKPDPHMTLLLALMGDFPKNKTNNGGAPGIADDPESEGDGEVPGPRSYDFFA
jgi:hypothetical protein